MKHIFFFLSKIKTMKNTTTFFLSLLAFCAVSSPLTAQDNSITNYYFIRHAEKVTANPSDRDPDLTPTGERHARYWAEVLKDVPFDAVYSSPYLRTKKTAAAFTNPQALTIQLYDPRQLYDVDFQTKTLGKHVLVVGHSNTNPTFVNQIIGEEKYEWIDEKNYNTLFIVTKIGEKTSAVLLNVPFE